MAAQAEGQTPAPYAPGKDTAELFFSPSGQNRVKRAGPTTKHHPMWSLIVAYANVPPEKLETQSCY